MGAMKCQENNCKFTRKSPFHFNAPKNQWKRQNKKVVKLKITAKKVTNCDIQEVFWLFLSQTNAIIAKIAKSEECADHQVKKRSRWKFRWKGTLFLLWKKATKIPSKCSKNVKETINNSFLDKLNLEWFFGKLGENFVLLMNI